MDQHWLTLLIVLLIVGIIFDGVRRMRKARRDSIKMALKPAKRKVDDIKADDVESAPSDTSNRYGSEFPNGGARVSERQIDPNRINQARNKYNFGTDMSAWKNKVAEKIAEHTGINKPAREDGSDHANAKKAPRIEPSFEHADPLLDKLSEDEPLAEEGDTYLEYEEVAEGVEEEKMTDYASGHQIDSHTDQYEPAIADTAERESRSRPESKRTKEPVQVSLNLEDSVPMLMDSLAETSDGSTEIADDFSDDGIVEGSIRAKSPPEKIVKVGTRIEPVHIEEERTLGSHSANKPRYESKYTDHAKHRDVQQQVAAPQEVLVIHIRAAENEYFYGGDLLELILDNGLRFGAMDIFHRHAGEDGEGPILFSMANMVKPGIFDLHTFEEFSTVGLSFFLGLPTETGANMDAFDTMLSTAQDIAKKLQGELKDENRSVLTKQTIEHYRERIRDFTRRQRLEKNKP